MLPYKNAIAVAAHRGNSRYFPENTMAAFRPALMPKPDLIEIDLHMTLDGQVILMRDHCVNRTTDGRGLVLEKTLRKSKGWTQVVGRMKNFEANGCQPLRSFLTL